MARGTPASFKPETGAWVPSVGGTTTTAGFVHSQQSGWYSRIGKIVYVQFAVVFDYAGGALGSPLVTGLPYAIDGSIQLGAGGNDAGVILLTTANNLVPPANLAGWFMQARNAEAAGWEGLLLFYWHSGSNPGAGSFSHFAAANNQLVGSGWYRTP